jgi:hypothetical protein
VTTTTRPTTQGRAGTPDTGAVDLTKETALLKDSSMVMVDNEAMNKNVKNLWSNLISELLQIEMVSEPSLEGRFEFVMLRRALKKNKIYSQAS